MKIISKRARYQETRVVKQDVELVEVQSSIIFTDNGGRMSDEDIRRAIEVFKEMRRQLEGTIILSTKMFKQWKAWYNS